MNEQTKQELLELSPPTELQLAPAIDNGEKSLYFNPARFEQTYRASRMLASSDMVPDAYRGKSANCFIALQVADRMQIDPFMYMQNTYVVHGKPGLNGSLAIALINSKGPFTEPIQFTFKGTASKDRQCTATGILPNGRKCQSTVTWQMVTDEGWTSNKKWFSIQDQMFSYRSAAFLGRLYCPEVLMGMQTVEELIDVGPQAGQEIDKPKTGNEGLKNILSKPVDSQVVPDEDAEALGEAIETEQPQCPDDLLPKELRPEPDPQGQAAQPQGPEPWDEELENAKDNGGPGQMPANPVAEPDPMGPLPYKCPTCKHDCLQSELKSRKSQRKSADGTHRTIYYCPKCLVEAKI